jgi:hypothetical protein
LAFFFFFFFFFKVERWFAHSEDFFVLNTLILKTDVFSMLITIASSELLPINDTCLAGGKVTPKPFVFLLDFCSFFLKKKNIYYRRESQRWGKTGQQVNGQSTQVWDGT